MKKIICLTLSFCLLLACFSTVAFGADERPILDVGGYYLQAYPAGVTMAVKMYAQNGSSLGEITINSTKMIDIGTKNYACIYPNAEKMEITLAGLPKGEYLLLLSEGTGDIPNKDSNIYYINQYSGEGKASFTVYPADVYNAQTQTSMKEIVPMTLFITNDAGFKTVLLKIGYAPEKSYRAMPTVFGDVNNDNFADAMDATMILKNVVGKVTDQDTFISDVGDANFDGVVDAMDATLLLKKTVGNVDACFREIL